MHTGPAGKLVDGAKMIPGRHPENAEGRAGTAGGLYAAVSDASGGYRVSRAECPPEIIIAEHGKATVHSLRHAFASWRLQNRATLNEAGLRCPVRDGSVTASCCCDHRLPPKHIFGH